MDKDQLLKLNPEQACNRIEHFIRGYALTLNRDGAVVGLSGGLDSAVVLKLCIKALGTKRVKAILLPERDSQKLNIKDARNLCKSLNIDYVMKKITLPLWALGVYRLFPPAFMFPKSAINKFIAKTISKLSKDMGQQPFMASMEGGHRQLAKPVAFIRIKNRLRAGALFYYSELYNYLLVGTANKSEWLTGLFVKYGDGIADIMPLLDLYKTQVISMAEYLQLPENIISKQPSPDLAGNLTDEQLLNLPYQKLDLVLAGIEHNLTFGHISEIAAVSIEEIEQVQAMVNKSEWQRQSPVSLNF
ncbi:MAG: NAD(+) synthase [Actinomycetia bacterium]|nr:NAD(+) synthase [Actinomycetes bacterium]